MTTYYPAEHPHAHIIDQHRAARHESEAADRAGWQPRKTRDVPPEKWIEGVHYDRLYPVEES